MPTAFADVLLLRLADPTALLSLLAPSGDPAPSRLQRLFQAAYDLPFATLHDVREPTVVRTEFARPVFPPSRARGTWTQATPSYLRTDFDVEGLAPFQPLWLDVVIDLYVKVLLEIDPGAVQSIVTQEIPDFKTLDEFRAHFQFFDLDSFMRQHGITTVAELRERFHYFLTEIRMKAPPAFDPGDPANLYLVPLPVAILLRDTLDVTGLLRAAKLARIAQERAVARPAQQGPVELRAPFAPLLVLPDTILTGSTITLAQLQGLFTNEGVVVVLVPSA